MASQSTNSFPWARLLAWTFGILLLLAAVGYLTASFLLNHYLRGEAFRALVNQKTSAYFHAEGEYMPINREGFSFYSDSYAAHGKTGTALKELKADQIRADFEPAAIFDGAWRINNLQIQRVKIAFSSNALGISHNFSDAAAAPPAAQSAPATKKSRWIPERFELLHTRIEETELHWSPPGRAGSIQKMRLIIEPNGRDIILTGYGGRLEQAGLPLLEVDHLKLRCHYPEIFVSDSQFQLGEAGSIAASGKIDFGQNASADLLVKYGGIDIMPYLPVDWRASVMGSASGEANVSSSLQKVDTLHATGDIQLSNGYLKALPVLDKIAKFTQMPEFRQFALQKAQAHYTWDKGMLKVNELVMESERLIRLEGGFTLENGVLTGTFQIGVTPSSLQWLPGSRERVFKQEHDGYVWTTFKVNGPPDHLKEDLSPRLMAAAGEEVIEGVKGTLENGAKSLFDLLKPLAP